MTEQTISGRKAAWEFPLLSRSYVLMTAWCALCHVVAAVILLVMGFRWGMTFAVISWGVFVSATMPVWAFVSSPSLPGRRYVTLIVGLPILALAFKIDRYLSWAGFTSWCVLFVVATIGSWRLSHKLSASQAA